MALATGIWMAFFSIMANVGIGAVVWYEVINLFFCKCC